MMKWSICFLLLAGCGGLEFRSQAHAVTDDTECEGRFRWYQKNAYISDAQPLKPGWPPHTTTTFEIWCPCKDGKLDLESTTVMNNHGAKPTDTDNGKDPPDGKLLMTVTGCRKVAATYKNLKKFRDGYSACECAPHTDFLALTGALGGTLLTRFEAGLSQYFNTDANAVSVCDDAAKAGPALGALIAMLSLDGAAADNAAIVAKIIVQLSNGCTYNWPEAVKFALAKDYQSFHVCNNDATIETDLWMQFQSAPDTFDQACSNDSAKCEGPQMFFTAPKGDDSC